MCTGIRLRVMLMLGVDGHITLLPLPPSTVNWVDSMRYPNDNRHWEGLLVWLMITGFRV